MNRAATPLEISDVSVLYGANRVLDRVSLSAAGGEFIALLGASGCGKQHCCALSAGLFLWPRA